MKPINITVDLSEERGKTPEHKLTLADVEKDTACLEVLGETKYVTWKDENDHVLTICATQNNGEVFVQVDATPSDINVTRILGPIRIFFKL